MERGDRLGCFHFNLARKARAEVAEEKHPRPSLRMRNRTCAAKADFKFLVFEEGWRHLSCSAYSSSARPQHRQLRTRRGYGPGNVPAPAQGSAPPPGRFPHCREPAEGETAILGPGKIWPLQNRSQALRRPYPLRWASPTHPDPRCIAARSGWSH